MVPIVFGVAVASATPFWSGVANELPKRSQQLAGSREAAFARGNTIPPLPRRRLIRDEMEGSAPGILRHHKRWRTRLWQNSRAAATTWSGISERVCILEADLWSRKGSHRARELRLGLRESACRDGRRDRREFQASPPPRQVLACLRGGVRCALRSGLPLVADARRLHPRAAHANAPPRFL